MSRIVRQAHSLSFSRYALVLSVTLALSFGVAQSQLAALTVNGNPSEAGSFYFAEAGNTTDAFAQAQGLADALGMSFYIAENGALTLSGEGTNVSLEVSNSAEAGLVKKASALVRDGEAFESPLAILSNDTYYVPISPIVEALGGSSIFNYDSSTLEVSTTSPSTEAVEAELGESETRSAEADTPTDPATAEPPAQANNPAFNLAAPRIGLQDNGSTRIVVDLPANSIYTLATKDDVLVVSFPGMTGTAFSRELQDQNLKTLAYGNIGTDFALFVGSQHALSPTGAGFRSGLIPANEDGIERLYIDFAPTLQGETVAEATDSAPADPTTSRSTQAARNIVVIDAGHGAHDPGAVSSYGQEKDVVLAVALKLRDRLVSQGIEVIMTRDTDTFLELQQRADFANPNINIFISIHVNSVNQASASGVETWVFGVPLEQSTLSQAIRENGGGAEGAALTQDAVEFANSIPGKIVQEEQLRYSLSLAEEVQSELVAATGAQDRGIKKNAYVVIRNARTAAILVELGFITNPDEGPKLTSDAYQTMLAQSLAKGIRDFLSEGLVASQ